MNHRLFIIFVCFILSLGFNYEPAGVLIPGSGNGQSNSPIHLVDMRFPIEAAPAYPNSQVYRPGGLHGGGGSQCDASNYDYPWQDNFCETRTSYTMPMCPDGTGHQGQDIRPSTCDDSTHWVVATENGTITVVGTYSVYLEGTSGIRHRFLHMDMNTVTVNIGDYVTKGQRLGKVSNDFGGTSTTIHLHYDMYKYVSSVGSVYVSPYNTLISSYEILLGYSGIENSGGTCTPTPQSNALGNRFEDVVTGSTGEDHIYALADAGVTQGCAANLFCPECDVERYQMAVFIARAASLDISNPPSTPSFTDVASTQWWYPHVEAVKAAGIVNGCSPTEFCPHDSLTRAQAAKFLALGADLPIISPTTPTFSDVSSSDWEYDYVETIKEYCITQGCNGTTTEFCPDDIVSRRIAAIFIARTFDLDDLNSCVNYCDTTMCDDLSFCDDYGDCENFTDDCDETGEQSRECHDFACLGTYTNGSCDYSSQTETQSCSRDTDGLVHSPYTEWGDCNIQTVNFDCSGDGVQERTQGVCSSGVSVEETESQACSVDSVDASLRATHEALWFIDRDGDGFGDEADPGTIYCADPQDGSVLNNTDCNDDINGGGSISPSAFEACDGVDNNCDGTIDEDCSEGANGEEIKEGSSGCAISSELGHQNKWFVLILLIPFVLVRREGICQQ